MFKMGTLNRARNRGEALRNICPAVHAPRMMTEGLPAATNATLASNSHSKEEKGDSVLAELPELLVIPVAKALNVPRVGRIHHPAATFQAPPPEVRILILLFPARTPG